MKKFFAILLSASMLFLFAACSSSPESQSYTSYDSNSYGSSSGTDTSSDYSSSSSDYSSSSSGYSSSSSSYSSSSGYSSSDYSDYDSYDSDDYDYDKGYGYTAPEAGESFSDYVKRQDPELYESMQDAWDSLDD